MEFRLGLNHNFIMFQVRALLSSLVQIHSQKAKTLEKKHSRPLPFFFPFDVQEDPLKEEKKVLSEREEVWFLFCRSKNELITCWVFFFLLVIHGLIFHFYVHENMGSGK